MSFRVQGLEQLDAFAAALQSVPIGAGKAVEKVLNRGGVEMKKKMESDFSGSRSFGHVARSITYDVDGTRLEVGPDAARSRSAPLAGIAYFGGANGGGGTVAEPDYILEEEAEAATKYIGLELEKLL